MTTHKKLPIGVQTFRTIIEGGFYYVDKTALACQLIEEGSYYFLSRPRRFGKSLFLDTLKSIFFGEKELFVGLAAELKGARAKTDWSLDPETSCDCVYCKPVASFVRSVGEAQGIWGLAAQNRDHVMRHFGGLGLPLDFEVRKQGSPHKLVVTKNPRLHRDAQERYQRVLALGARLVD